MVATLNYNLRDAPADVFEGIRWTLLTFFILHANERNRSWPSMAGLATRLGRSLPYVTEAKQWLIEHGAVRLVPFKERVGDTEKGVPKRQHMYELTGKIKIGETIVQYIYLAPTNGDCEKDMDQPGLSSTPLMINPADDQPGSPLNVSRKNLNKSKKKIQNTFAKPAIAALPGDADALNAQLEQTRKEQEAQASKPALAVVDHQVPPPPAGYERLYVSRQIDQESRANIEHLVLASSSTPTPKCKRCALVLADGQVSQLPTPGTTYVRCLGDEPKKARASPKEPAEHDPLFDWCARHLIGNDPAAVYVDKELIGWCWKLVSKIVTAEKRLTGAKSLNIQARKVAEGKLPGFLWYFSVQCKGCSLSDTKKFAKWINKWYEAGRPQSQQESADSSDYVSEIDTTKGKLYAVPAK